MRDWLSQSPALDTSTLVPLAIKAIESVRSGPTTSELFELWEESDSFAEWSGTISDLLTALRRPGS